MPVVQSIKVYRAEDIVLNFTMSPAVDITGWVLSLTVAKAYNNPNKIFQQTGVITNGPNGLFTVQLTSAQLDITPDRYVYDVWRTSPGNARILSVGDFIVAADAREP